MSDSTDETAWAYRLYDAQKLGLETYLHGDPKPTRNQVAAVLHALADHTLLEHAVSVAPFAGSDRREYGFTFQYATGLGRWLQQMGNALETLPGLDPQPHSSSTEEK